MTLATTTSAVSYRGNGVTTTFDFGFEIPAGALVVTLTETDVVTTLADTAYTATGLGGSSGGSVTLATAPTSSQTVTLRRVLAPTQSVALVTGAAIYADVLESGFDRAAMVDQQLQEQLDRAVLVPVGSDIDPGDYLSTCSSAAATAAAAQAICTDAATVAAASATAAQQAVGGVRVSAADTAAATLSAKLAVSGLVAKSIANPGAAEVLTLSVPVAGSTKAIAGTATDCAMTPADTAAAIAAQGTPGSSAPGHVRALVLTASDTAATITAEVVVVGGSAGATKTLTSYSQSIAAGSVGAGGLDAGSLAANTLYYVWAIAKADGTAGALLSLSATAPTMPSGYTFKTLLGWVLTNASGKIRAMIKKGRRWQYVLDLTTNPVLPLVASGSAGSLTTPTWVAVNLASFLPVSLVSSILLACATGNASDTIILAPNSNYGAIASSTLQPIFIGGVYGASGNWASVVDLMLESSSFYWASNNAECKVRLLGGEDLF